MCYNPNSEKPGSANSRINIKTQHVVDIFYGDRYVVTARYSLGGSRTIGYEEYHNALKVFNHWINDHVKQRIISVKLERIGLQEPISNTSRHRLRPENLKIDEEFLKIWEKNEKGNVFEREKR